MNGTDLLGEFRRTRSDAAFGELVRRYTNLVFSVARRRIANLALAQEVTQVVFIRLARAAPNIRSDAELVAWLHRTTVHASIDLWRTESRRQAREQTAITMQPDHPEQTVWNEIAPNLDELLNELNENERRAILLRFFDERSMREVGAACGITEDAAKMRVSRGIEKLRTSFSKRGVSCSAFVLSGLLAEKSVTAAPAELVGLLAKIRVPAAAGLGAGTILGLVLATAKSDPLIVGATALLLVAAAAFVLQSTKNTERKQSEVIEKSNEAEAANTNDAETSGTAVVASAQVQVGNAVDPNKLLQGVIRARRRIESGEIEFEVLSVETDMLYLGTNRSRIKAVFDDQRRRFESFSRQYAYVSTDPNAADVAIAEMRARALDQETAVKAGLLKGFEAHRVTAYQGTELLSYWENDGQPFQAKIEDPAKGSMDYVFDPRCLGMVISPNIRDSVMSNLAEASGSSVQLLGTEIVEGKRTWHIRIQVASQTSDFWIDISNPIRVVQHAWNGSTVVSKYSDKDPRDPLPIEAVEDFLHGTSGSGTAYTQKRFVRRNARFNVPVDPACCTLAGLGMKVGTEVVDYRISRRIGYWNGSGLSENFPDTKSLNHPAPDRVQLIEMIEKDPKSTAAFEAAQWVLLNTEDGPDVQKAGDVILNYQIQNTNLVLIAQEMGRIRHKSCRQLLEAMLEKNPARDVRGNACFSLATIRKSDAKYGAEKQATEEAKSLFQRVINDFSQVKRNGTTLEKLAKPELLELQRLSIGKHAPETIGDDLSGQHMSLEQFRGKVVVLTFWGECGGCRPEVKELRDLLDRQSGKPFELVGVYCDDDPSRGAAIAEDMGMNWESFYGGRDGSIPTAWNNHSWPSTFVLDKHGIIRFREVRGRDLAKAVDRLVNE
jgi:RNA polymerase sigma factor (sigma-70 family)